MLSAESSHTQTAGLSLKFSVTVFYGVLMRPFALVCFSSIATEERALLFKARQLYWTLTFSWMRRLTVKRCRDIRDSRCTVRVPDSHHSNPHYRVTDKRLMLCNLQGRGREKKKRAGGSKPLCMYFCEFKIHILHVWKNICDIQE